MQNVRNGLLAAILAASALTGAAASASVVNGSFETGVPGNSPGLVFGSNFADMPTSGPSWDIFSGLNGWTTVRGPGVEVQTNGTLPTIDAQDGNYYVELDSSANSAIYQNVALNVGRYVMSFWYSPRTASQRTNAINYRLSGLAAGQVSNATPGAAVGTWTQISVEFIVTKAKNYRLQFGAAGASDGIGGLLDNVEIAAVPVPASGLVLMGALGGLAALRRRKTA